MTIIDLKRKFSWIRSFTFQVKWITYNMVIFSLVKYTYFRPKYRSYKHMKVQIPIFQMLYNRTDYNHRPTKKKKKTPQFMHVLPFILTNILSSQKDMSIEIQTLGFQRLRRTVWKLNHLIYQDYPHPGRGGTGHYPFSSSLQYKDQPPW